MPVWRIFLWKYSFLKCRLSNFSTVYQKYALVPDAMPWTKNFRIPAHILPLHYNLLLKPDIRNGTFSGEVTVRVDVKQASSFLALNIKKLDVYSTKLTSSDGKSVEVESAFEYEPHEFWVVQASLQPREYDLHLMFRGSLTDKIIGFYRSSYLDKKSNQSRYIATSKFEPTYARQAFPCFDEPNFKSKYSIKLLAPEGYTALSNMDITNSYREGESTVYEFRESVPMSTYLACFIVSDFERLHPVDVQNYSNSFPVSVYSTPAQTNKTAYALDVGVKIVKYYIDMFKIDYPLPKLDLIAIPDFVSGAMEHWGLITFRETALLFDDNSSSVINKQRVATVIGHELAHMWFGNLVTLKWWDDLWLNEGFASYVEYKGVHAVHPDWSIMDQFLIDDLHPVLSLDAVLSSHPIVQPVSHPDEITSIFDSISYNKGASVIRMLEDFLSSEKFENGITNFLNKYKFDNAVTKDLWDSLQEAVDGSEINVAEVMDTWTRQMGFPVINVTLNKDGSRTLKQKRFLADPDAVSDKNSPFGYKWEIPITYITGKNKEVQRVWLHQNQSSLDIPPIGNTWIKINCQQIGYYRVNYDLKDWKNLINELNNNTQAFLPSDRAHLLEDSFSLAEASQLDYKVPLDMTSYLINETHYVPWAVAVTKFKFLLGIVSSNAKTTDKLKTYIRKQVDKIYHTLDWNVENSDSHLQRRLRIAVLDLACIADLDVCKTQVTEKFNSWMENVDKKPHPDIRTLVYRHGIAQNEDADHFNKMWKVFISETDAQEKIKLMAGLSATKYVKQIEWLIEQAKKDEHVRSQDFLTFLHFLAENPNGHEIVWKFVRNEWQYLVKRFTLNDRYLGTTIKDITKTFSTQEKLDEMNEFFTKNPEAGAGVAARKQALDMVKNNIKWVEKNLGGVDDWLSA